MERRILIIAFIVSVLLFVATALVSFKVGFDTAKDIVENSTSSGKLRAIECPNSFRGTEICTKEYVPVCGWYNSSKVQCIKYPCAIDAGNICEACSNLDVEYYTDGLCPSENILA